MQNLSFTFSCGILLILGMAGSAAAQDKGGEQPSARHQLQHIHTPQSIDQELARLSKDLELTRTDHEWGKGHSGNRLRDGALRHADKGSRATERSPCPQSCDNCNKPRLAAGPSDAAYNSPLFR
jgi:hypothetical protein